MLLGLLCTNWEGGVKLKPGWPTVNYVLSNQLQSKHTHWLHTNKGWPVRCQYKLRYKMSIQVKMRQKLPSIFSVLAFIQGTTKYNITAVYCRMALSSVCCCWNATVSIFRVTFLKFVACCQRDATNLVPGEGSFSLSKRARNLKFLWTFRGLFTLFQAKSAFKANLESEQDFRVYFWHCAIPL